MPAPIIRKIPLSKSKINTTDTVEIDGGSFPLPMNIFANVLAFDYSNDYIVYDSPLNLENEGIAEFIDPTISNSGNNGAGIGDTFIVGGFENKASNMFDGNKFTSLGFKGQWGGFNNYFRSQLVFYFGRQIKPRKIILSFSLYNQDPTIGSEAYNDAASNNDEDNSVIEGQNTAKVKVAFSNDLSTISKVITGNDGPNIDLNGDGVFNPNVDFSTTITLGSPTEGVGDSFIGDDFVIDTFQNTQTISKQLTLDQNFFSNEEADNNQYLIFDIYLIFT